MKSFFVTLLLGFLAAGASAQSVNLDAVNNIYTAYLNRDMPALMDLLSDEPTLSHPGEPSIVPFAGDWGGKEAIHKFFDNGFASVNVKTIEVSNAIESGNTVVVTVHTVGTAVLTDTDYETTLQYAWTFDADGRAIHCQVTGSLDSLTAALQGKPKTDDEGTGIN